MADDYFVYLQNIPSPYFLLLACLITAVVCSSVTRSTNTATVLMFLIPFSISVLHDSVFGCCEAMKKLDVISSMPHLMEFVVVPPVIFNCAVSLDPQEFKRVLWQLLILAVPCFITSSFFFGCSIFLYFYYTMKEEYHVILEFVHVFKLAGFLTAIDPIAVSTVADDLGISNRLIVLLKFESLLSQASVVLFNNVIKLSFDTGLVWEVVEDIGGILGCLLAGYIFGRALGLLLGSVLYVDHVAEYGITFVMIYVSYSAGLMLKSSGVLCVLVFAVTFNMYKNVVSRKTYDDIRRIWGTVAYCSNAIMVSCAGITIGRNYAMFEYTNVAYGLFPMAVLSRFVSIMMFTWLLRCAGGFDIYSVTIMVAAGLRGFLPLLLLVREFNQETKPRAKDGDIFPHEYKRELMFVETAASSISIVGLLSNLVQGLCASWIANRLGLQSRRVHPEFMRSLEKRVNGIIKEKINARKQLKENADVLWSLIEKDIVFNFEDRSDAEKREKVQAEQLRQASARLEEEEARQRVQRCYEAHVRKMSYSYGHITAGASRALANAISEAATNRCALNIDELFEQLQPNPIWRRFASFGRKWAARLPVKRVLDHFSVYETFWRWRLFVCILNSVAASMMIYVSVNAEKMDVTTKSFFYGCVFSSILTVEQVIRIRRLMTQFKPVFRDGSFKSKGWFWFETIILLVQLIIDAANGAVIWGECLDKELSHMFLDTAICHRLGRVLIVANSLLMIQAPFIFGLLLRLGLSEVEHHVQTCDEETFDAFTGLVAVTDSVIRLLAGQTLVQRPFLKKKLSDECLVSKHAMEDKLIELLNRQGAEATLTSIKTRQAARELIEDAATLLMQAKESGMLRDFEYHCLEGMVDEKRAEIQLLGQQKMDRGRPISEVADDSLVRQLSQMEWVQAASSHTNVADLIQQLKSVGRFKNYKRKTVIFSQGDAPSEPGLFILLRGFCRAAIFEAEDFHLNLLHAGTVFGITGFFGEPYAETVTVASPLAMTFWLSSKMLEKVPSGVKEAFMKFVVEKACVHYLRQAERFHAWSDDMLYSYVRRMLKWTSAGEEIPAEYGSFVLLVGTVVDGYGKRYSATPSRPMRVGSHCRRPVTVPKDIPLVYYMIHRTSGSASDHEGSAEELGDSFLMLELDSTVSALSQSPHSAVARSSTRPKRFAPLSYTKVKKKQ